MRKSELIEAIAGRTELPLTTVERVLVGFAEVMFATVAKDERVMTGFGVFVLRRRRPMAMRDPNTGDERRIGERRSVGFRPAEALRDRLNRG